jgi:hypothetical protein
MAANNVPGNISVNYAISILREASALGSHKTDVDGNPLATRQDLAREFGRLVQRGNTKGASIIGTILVGAKDKLGYFNQIASLDGKRDVSIQDLVAFAAKGDDSKGSIGTRDFKVVGGNRYDPGKPLDQAKIRQIAGGYQNPGYYQDNGGYLGSSGNYGYGGDNNMMSFFTQLFQNFFSGGYGNNGNNDDSYYI